MQITLTWCEGMNKKNIAVSHVLVIIALIQNQVMEDEKAKRGM